MGPIFFEHLENDIAGWHPLGLQTITGVLGNTFGLEYAHNDSCRHLSLLVIQSLTLPERSNGDKARRGVRRRWRGLEPLVGEPLPARRTAGIRCVMRAGRA